MDYGKAIRTARASRGLSQTELSNRSGFSSAYISKIEDGQRKATVDSIQKIATSLGIPFELLSLLAAQPSAIKRMSSSTAAQLAKDLLIVLAEKTD